MPAVVYVDPLSAPAHSVWMTVRALGLEPVLEVRQISLVNRDHQKPEYVKKFPMHAVPALEDGDLYLSDSHAICAYLVAAYATDDKLYPREAKKRAKVDQWLHFSNSNLYVKLRDMTEPLWRGQRKDIPEDKKVRLASTLRLMQDVLGGGQWLCGDHVTLADICCVCQLQGLLAVSGDISHLTALCAWYERCKAVLPGFSEIVLEGSEKYKALLKMLMS